METGLIIIVGIATYIVGFLVGVLIASVLSSSRDYSEEEE